MTPASVIDLPPVLDGIEAVCFDAFGTLVEIAEKRHAFRSLFKALSPETRRELKHRLRREDRPFTHWLEALGNEVYPRVLLEVMERVMIETGSVALRLALCSNLANDYAQSLQSALPDASDVEVLSCKVGAIKPEPAIYAAVLDGLQIEASRVLFVGDTPRADIEGPRAAGMKAVHVDELAAPMRPKLHSGIWNSHVSLVEDLDSSEYDIKAT